MRSAANANELNKYVGFSFGTFSDGGSTPPASTNSPFPELSNSFLKYPHKYFNFIHITLDCFSCISLEIFLVPLHGGGLRRLHPPACPSHRMNSDFTAAGSVSGWFWRPPHGPPSTIRAFRRKIVVMASSPGGGRRSGNVVGPAGFSVIGSRRYLRNSPPPKASRSKRPNTWTAPPCAIPWVAPGVPSG